MKFEKVKTFVTGKTKEERLQERAAKKEIRKAERAAYFRAKKQEALKFASAKASYERQQQEKKMRQPSGFGNFLGSFTEPVPRATRTVRVVRRPSKAKGAARKGKRRIRRVARVGTPRGSSSIGGVFESSMWNSSI